MSDKKNIIHFVACPNHDTNVGWGSLRFVTKDLIRCDLCLKEYTVEEIRKEITTDYHDQLANLQRSYLQKLVDLQKMSESARCD